MLLAASLSLAPCSIDATAVAQQPSARIIETASGGSTLALAKILILRDGTYVASVESMTYPMEAPRPGWVSLWGTIHLSTDRGEHWSKVAKLDEIGRATLFEDGDALYFMGTSKSGGAVISRSTDHAATWSKPTSASTGMLHGQSVLEPCDGPAVRAGGRIWRAFTRELQPTGTRERVHALVASAAVGADLLDAKSWRWTSELPLDGLNGFAWDHSGLVGRGEVAPDLILLSRDDFRGAASPSPDGFELRAHELPRPWVGCDRLGARLEHDSTSGQFFVLAAFPDSTNSQIPPETLASEASLLATRDLTSWDLRTVLLRGERRARFTCADWAIDGEDLVAVIGGALGEEHDTRALLFLRVPKFRERKFEDPPASVPAVGK